ncbi:MAG: DUF3883 domain-containing protein [Bacteroidetes bacterium]|nr:DUF3883 domain-containing protein [Bacteroidota bacterium]
MKTKDFIAQIEKRSALRRREYKDDPDRLTADYNREVELTKEYNGRQILEMLQNADDSGSKEALISLDKKARTLSISDKGSSFTFKGVKSLMMSDLSSKIKRSYIGNKGLGFRSMLNWANEVRILTNGTRITFSQKIAKAEFYSIFSENERANIRTERGLNNRAIPFATLAIPEVREELQDANWNTTVSISYKNSFETKIEEQLQQVCEEVLLFLNNIDTLRIEVDGLEEVYERTKLTGGEKIKIGSKTWSIVKDEGVLPEEYQDNNKQEKDHYQIAIAYQNDLSDTFNRLFTFFPTNVRVTLPCLVHGTFELNSSRKDINDSEKNEFIFGKLAALFRKVASSLAQEKVDWRSYKLLTPVDAIPESALVQKFYKLLEEERRTAVIYPCVGGAYCSFNDIHYYNSGFSKWIFDHNYTTHFADLLLPPPLTLEGQITYSQRYKLAVLVNRLDNLSKEIASIKDRAELIVWLTDSVFAIRNAQTKCSLLIDDDNKVINKDKTAFTPPLKNDAKLTIPRFVLIAVINTELYSLLVSKLRGQFRRGEQESRELQRVLNSIVNLQPYDSNNVITRIITGTREHLKRSDVSVHPERIRQMVAALFANYQMLRDKKETFTATCPLVDRNHVVRESNELFLNNTYPSGILTQEVYDGVFSNSNFIADVDFFNVKNVEPGVLESFFIWLGVNKTSRLSSRTFSVESWAKDAYLEYVFSQRPKPALVSRYHLNITMIALVEVVGKLTPEKLLLLICKDASLKQQITSASHDTLQYQYGNNYNTIAEKPSFIRHQLIEIKTFKDYIIDDYGVPFINTYWVNPSAAIFKRYEIKESEIRYILPYLGATTSFNELSKEKVWQLLSQCDLLDPKGNYARKLYSLVLNYSKTNNVTIRPSDNTNYKLLAVKNGVKEYRLVTEVYYSDNNTLPSRILANYWLLDYAKRGGEEQIATVLGVKTFKKINIQIDRYSAAEHRYAYQLQDWFSKIKPLILAHRIKPLNKTDEKQTAAALIKKCKISLVSAVKYSIDGGSKCDLDINEFLVEGNDRFLVCASQYSALEDLKHTPEFCDSFAELMCILFKINDLKTEFRQLFKDDLSDSMHVISTDLGSEILDEARTLLGINNELWNFWNNISELVNKKSLPSLINNEKELNEFLGNDIGFGLPKNNAKIDYAEFNSIESINLLSNLRSKYTLSIEAMLKHKPSGLMIWHKAQTIVEIANQETNFKNHLWSFLLGKSVSNQETFRHKLYNFRNEILSGCLEEINRNKYSMDFDYIACIQSVIKRIYHIDVTSKIKLSNKIACQYSALLEKYSIALADIPDDKTASLLYFPGHSELIESRLKALAGTQEAVNPGLQDINPEDIHIVKATPTKSSVTGKMGGRHNTAPWTHTKASDFQKKQAGKTAEQLVYDKFCDLYGEANVKWRSGNSDSPDRADGLHYDIEYLNPEKKWKKLEVKSYNGSSFVISRDEKNLGITDSQDYEIALVSGTTIYHLDDFFKYGEGESFENCKRYTVTPRDYDVYLTVSPKK